MQRNRCYTCRSCNAAKGRLFYAANADRMVALARRRRNADLEKARTYWRKHRDESREAHNAYHRGYQAAKDETPEGRARRIIARTRALAKYRGIEFDISLEWLTEKLATGRCEATGLPFDFRRPPREERGSRTPAFAPSLDRIERGGSYTQDNVRVVAFIYNVARSDFDDADLMTLAKALIASA